MGAPLGLFCTFSGALLVMWVTYRFYDSNAYRSRYAYKGFLISTVFGATLTMGATNLAFQANSQWNWVPCGLFITLFAAWVVYKICNAISFDGEDKLKVFAVYTSFLTVLASGATLTFATTETAPGAKDALIQWVGCNWAFGGLLGVLLLWILGGVAKH